MRSPRIIAAVIALAAVGWIGSGQLPDDALDHLFGPADEPAPTTDPTAEPTPAPMPAMRVRVRQVSAAAVERELSLLGHTLENRQVVLKAETAGRVVEVLAARGRPIEADAALVRLALDARQSELDHARTHLAQREIEFAAAQNLAQKGFNSEVRFAEARAARDAALAAVVRAEREVERTLIRAPFAGVVADRPVEVGDYLADGDPVATVVELDPIRIFGAVGERNRDGVTLGQPARVALITGRTLAATVSYLAPVATPETRTYRLELTAANSDGAVAAGMTARITLPIARAPAHLVPHSALSLADDGTLGVKTVEPGNRVGFAAVAILSDGRDGVWVTGLADPATVITVGHEFVAPGARIEPVVDPSPQADRRPRPPGALADAAAEHRP